MNVILTVGVPTSEITEEMRGGLPVESVDVADLPKRLIRDMDAAIIFSAEHEPAVMLCAAAQPADEGRPTLLMFRDGRLFQSS